MLAVIFAAAGCQSTPAPDAGEPEAVETGPDASADSLLDAAADAPEGRRARLYLQAAEQLLAEGDPASAGAALAQVDVERLRDRQSARYLLALGRVALAEERLEDARAALLAVDPALLPRPLDAARATAELLVAEGRPQAAAAHLMAVEPPDDPGAQQRHNDLIWHYLGQVPPFEVIALGAQGAGTAAGWWRLKAQMLTSLTLTEQRERLEAWRRTHPGHPAAMQPPSALAVLDAPPPPVRRVALLLPLSGPLSRAGQSVRDGFLATYLSHRSQVSFDVRIYDTAAEPVPVLYERALVDGADVLIGPLDKDAVVQLNALEPDLPVLALNYLDDGQPAANVLQLGLAIEDEALTLERWLDDEQADRVLALYNAEDWSRRAVRALSDARDEPLTVQMLENIRTVTESVGVAMHVAASQDRHQALQDLLGQELEFLPRARHDVDAIVALVTPLEASALVPALRFHFAGNVPVYATSQTVRGADRERLRELNGFRVSELPWLTREEPTFTELDAAFGLRDSPFVGLYALGVDAFRLADRAALIIAGHFTELLGSTGELEFTPNGRIQRRLARAVIAGGRLVPRAAVTGR